MYVHENVVRFFFWGGERGINPFIPLPLRVYAPDVGMVIWDEVQISIWPSRCHCHSLSLAPVNPDWFYLPGFYLFWYLLT